MLKLSTLILGLFIGGSAFSQLSIKPSANQDHFLYVEGSLLFVHKEVNLIKNREGQYVKANLFFRSEAQLLQGGSEASKNTGDGSISIFQEGTSNAFDYNYWASPVGTATTPPLFGIEMLYSPISRTESVKAQTTDALDGNSVPLTISNRWIHTFAGNGYSSWKYIGNRTEIPAGYGFSMKGVNGTDLTTVDGRPNNPGNSQRYDFRGMPHNGTLFVPVAAGQHVLIGNPYPSALDLSLFLLENSGTGSFASDCYGNIGRNDITTGIAYFWDSKEKGSSHYLADYVGGYGAFSPVDPCTTGIYERPIFSSYGKNAPEQIPELRGNHYERRYLPIAQGFMMEGRSNGNIFFTNAHRIFKKEGDHSEFKQRKRVESEIKVIPKLRFQVEINETYTRNLSLGFWPNATSSIDFGMDAKALDLTATDIGWFHEDTSYIIDVRPFNEKDEIPLFLSVEDSLASFKFRLIERENMDAREVFLLDRETNRSYFLGTDPINIVLETGNYHQRLALVFQERKDNPNNEVEEPTHEDENPFTGDEGSGSENEDSDTEDEGSDNDNEAPSREDEDPGMENEEPSAEDEDPDTEEEDPSQANEGSNNDGEDSFTGHEGSDNEVHTPPIVREDNPNINEDPLSPEGNELIIFHNYELQQIEVINPLQKNISRIFLYSLNGKELKMWNSPGNKEKFSLSTDNFPESLYLLKLVQDNSTEITKKILILE